MNAKQFKHSILPSDYEKMDSERKKLLDELIEVEEKYSEKQLIIADLFQLGRNGNKFDYDMRKLWRGNGLVEVPYFVKTNWQWRDAGKLYVINEEATEKRYEDHISWREMISENNDLKAEVGVALKDAMAAIGETANERVLSKKEKRALKK